MLRLFTCDSCHKLKSLLDGWSQTERIGKKGKLEEKLYCESCRIAKEIVVDYIWDISKRGE